MKTITIIILLVFLVMTPVTSRANDLGISLHMPTEFEIQCGIRSSFNEQVFHNASARLELNGNIHIAIERSLTNSPYPWTTLADNLNDTKDMFLFCHGATDGSLVLEHYRDLSVALTAYQDYQNAYPNCDYFALNSTRDAIFLRPSGIENLLTPNSDSDGNKLVFACYSYISKNSWGDFSSYDEGGSFFGYPTSIDATTACEDLDKMSRVMACEGYASSGLENNIIFAYNETWGDGILSGNENNSFNPAVSCNSQDLEIVGVEAWAGEIRFVIQDEERWSQYLIEGVDQIGDRPDTLAIINGCGTDGVGTFRTHSASVPQRRLMRIIAYDNCCLTTVSDWIQWEKKTENRHIEPGEELSLLPLKVNASGDISNSFSAMASATKRPKVVDPADVIVYTTTGNESMANRIRGSWQMTQNSNGVHFRPRMWSGSDKPTAVRDLYESVYLANQAYNAANPETPYREFPILQIVGDGVERIVEGDTLRVGPRYFLWDDGINGGSGDGVFRSYGLMTDVNGDGIPDGPVVTIPLQDYTEAQTHADAVEEYNLAPFNDGVMMALDDYYSGVASEWLEDSAFSDFSNYVSTRGLNLKGILKESDWLPSEDVNIIAQMESAGSDLINSGVSEVWYTGLHAAISEHTIFLEGVPDWTNDQGFLLFGPTCNFGEGHSFPFGGGAQIRKEMFDNPHGGMVIGGIGSLSAAYTFAHMKLSQLMQEMLPQMPENILVVDAAFAIQQEFMQRYPELSEYGAGIHCIGSIAKLKSPSYSGVEDGYLAALNTFGLRSFATGNGAGLKFNLAKNAQISLNIYDIRGARIASIIHGESLNEGEHSMIWDGKGNGQPVASGTYFARIQSGTLSETVKFAFVK